MKEDLLLEQAEKLLPEPEPKTPKSVYLMIVVAMSLGFGRTHFYYVLIPIFLYTASRFSQVLRKPLLWCFTEAALVCIVAFFFGRLAVSINH